MSVSGGVPKYSELTQMFPVTVAQVRVKTKTTKYVGSGIKRVGLVMEKVGSGLKGLGSRIRDSQALGSRSAFF